MREHAIHIDWEAGYTIKHAAALNDDCDVGIYQVYGNHPVYGEDVLLYIGSAIDKTFAAAIRFDGWAFNRSSILVTGIVAGRLRGAEMLDDSNKPREIRLAEKMLLFAHMPVYNKRSLKLTPDKGLRHIHVYNWDEYRDLMPEVSGERWTSMFDAMPGYHYVCYDSH